MKFSFDTSYNHTSHMGVWEVNPPPIHMYEMGQEFPVCQFQSEDEENGLEL